MHVQGALSCANCPAGTFSAAPKSSACANCTAGTISALAGSGSCSACPVGQFSGRDQATVCSSCAPGRVQPKVGASLCNGKQSALFLLLIQSLVFASFARVRRLLERPVSASICASRVPRLPAWTILECNGSAILLQMRCWLLQSFTRRFNLLTVPGRVNCCESRQR